MHWVKSGGDLSVLSEFTADFLRWIFETAAGKWPWRIIYNCERATVKLKLPRIALKRPEMLRTYHK